VSAAGAGERDASGPSFKAADVASMLGAELIGDGSVEFRTLGSIENAAPGTLTFVRSEKFARKWSNSRASAVLVSREVYEQNAGRLAPGDGRAVLVVADADLAMVTLLEAAAKLIIRVPEAGVHPSAWVDESATLGEGVSIGAHASIGAGSVIGARTRIHPGVRIGSGVRIGEGCELRSNAVVEDRCVLGDRVILQPGASIGADGFGYRPKPGGGGVVKIPHIGAVELGDDVEIGANSCVDRGKFANTVIGNGSKIDNHVQIAHNVIVGSHSIICGNTGIAGSVKIGSGVTIGGMCAIHDGVSIGDGVTLAGCSGVLTDVPAGVVYGGIPAGPVQEAMRQLAAMRHLPEMAREYKRRKRVDAKLGEDAR